MILSILLFTIFSAPINAADKIVLPIYAFEVKPLLYQDENKKLKGTWYEGFEKIAAKAGITLQYQFMSVPRMELLLSKPKPGCNFMLLKTAKRAKEFNIDYIYEHDLTSTIKTFQRSDDDRVWTLKKLQADKNFKIITNSSVGIETLEEKGIKSELLFNINSILHMLMIKRIDLFVGSDLGVEMTDDFKAGKLKSGITLRKMQMSVGCSKATPKEVTDRLKKAFAGWSLRSIYR